MNVRLTRTFCVQARRSGWTLVEFMVAAGIASLVLSVVALLSVFSGRSFAALGNYVALDSKSREALDVMIRDIRQAKALTYYATNMLTFTGFTNQQLAYAWDPAAGTLTRSINGVPDPQPLLSNCMQLSFGAYQRNPSNAVYGFFVETNNLTQCKLIEVSWVCSRSILGRLINSESVQTAKIVIRNEKVQN